MDRKIIEQDLEFDEPSHTYTRKGVKYISTTTLLKDNFPFDAEGVALERSKVKGSPYFGKEVPDILEEWNQRGLKGTKMHNLIEDYLNGEFVTIDTQQETRAFEYAQKLWDTYDLMIPELRLFSEELQLAGMVDLLARKNGKWYILDWKSDKAVFKKGFNGQKCDGVLFEYDQCNYNKYLFQLGIYRYLLETYYGIPIAGAIVVHFSDMKATEYHLDYPINHIGLVIKKRLEEVNKK